MIIKISEEVFLDCAMTESLLFKNLKIFSNG